MSKYIEVLIAATVPEVWKVVEDTCIATQDQEKNPTNVEYIAFFRVRLGDKNIRSAITHIARVKNSNNKAYIREFFRKNPTLLEYSRKEGKGWEHKKYHKEYYLEKIEKLSKPILCRKGDGRRCQVKLYTTQKEFNKAKYLSDIKTVSQLKKLKGKK
jgi:hypothetical protein